MTQDNKNLMLKALVDFDAGKPLTIGAASPIAQNQFATDARALAYLAEKQRKRNARRDALILTFGAILALACIAAPFIIFAGV
tara:strand:- start:916 stop:1164 length:249 start_codon:yes stop_codon:yes gene_type:complete